MTNEISESILNLTDRKRLMLSGVSELLEYDDLIVRVDTSFGKFVISGSELGIQGLDLDKGIIEITGKINEMYYVDIQKTDKKSGLWGRLFR